MRIVLGIAILFIVLLVLLILGKTLASVPEPSPEVLPTNLRIDGEVAAQHLSSAIRFQTVSHQEAAQNQTSEFAAFHQYLEQTYPRLHRTLKREVVGGSSLLFAWEGKNPTLKPVLLLAHMDVVPVESGTEGEWTHPPFEGQIADGYVWGRGALDDKSPLIGILEAVELLVAEGFQPERTIYIASGHDEEVGGQGGAREIARLLSSRNVQLEYVLDEGLSITDGIVPGLAKPAALIALAEKGYASVELTVESQPGHSSMPPAETAIGILSAAISKLESHPMPARMDGPGTRLLQHLTPHMSFPMKMVFANQWLFGPIIERLMAAKPSTNASIRTTAAPTILEAGVKENVLPSRARAVVNFRILPGDSIESVLEHVRKTVDDPRVQVQALTEMLNEPSPVSAMNGVGYQAIEQSILSVFPEVVVAPGLMLAGADIRHFAELAENSYRFAPYWMRSEDLDRVHGLNERVSVENFARMIEFYYALIKSSTAS